MTRQEQAAFAIEFVIAVGIGVVTIGLAVGGAWKRVRRLGIEGTDPRGFA